MLVVISSILGRLRVLAANTRFVQALLLKLVRLLLGSGHQVTWAHFEIFQMLVAGSFQ